MDTLGNGLDRGQLDCGTKIPHLPVYESLAKLYNDTTVKELGVISNDDHIDYLSNVGIEPDIAGMYDELTAGDIYHLSRFIEKKTV